MTAIASKRYEIYFLLPWLPLGCSLGFPEQICSSFSFSSLLPTSILWLLFSNSHLGGSYVWVSYITNHRSPFGSRCRTNKASPHCCTSLVRKRAVIIVLSCLLFFTFTFKCNDPFIHLMYMNIYWAPTIFQHRAKWCTFTIFRSEVV